MHKGKPTEKIQAVSQNSGFVGDIFTQSFFAKQHDCSNCVIGIAK